MKKEIDPFSDDAVAEGSDAGSNVPVSNRSAAGLIQVALEKWWMIVIFAALGYVAALYYLSIKEPTTKARAVVEVTTKELQLVGQGDAERDSMIFRDEIIGTIASKITGQGQFVKVIQRPEVQALEKVIPPPLSLKPKYWRDESSREFQSAAETSETDFLELLYSGISVSNQRGTTLINIEMTHPDPETAKTIANAVMMVYIEGEQARRAGGSSDAFRILKAEADDVALELESAERSFHVYRAALALNQELNQFRTELSALRQRYLPKHPRRIEAEAVYEDLYNRFRREIDTASRTTEERDFWGLKRDEMRELDIEVRTAQTPSARAAAKDRWLSLVQSSLSARASILESRILNQRRLYETVTNRLTEIDVADETSNAEVTVFEEASIPPPSKYKHLITLAAGTVLGSGVGVGLVFLLSLLDYKIYNVRTAEEATGMACLAAIPLGSDFRRSGQKFESVIAIEPKTVHAESIRNLRASIRLLGRKERNQVICLTSALPGEGKTTTATELAAGFALAGERVLLVDFDLRKPRVHAEFPDLKGKPGTVELLTGQAEFSQAVHATGTENLYVMVSGKKAPSPSELLLPEDIQSLFDHAAEHFDRVIVDTPPVLPVSDTRLIAQHAQKSILVVRALKTPVGAVLRARDLLQDAKISLAGVVVNALRVKHTGGSGYYGYHGYGEYGHEGYYGDND
ncbi:polysaccharide biosynthesis tyrosine autokinase [Sulfuriroseicoccus oceanibius]|uniref:non-specific protein-tyrosine kinase n=1 Tax=Sulfuriroseicoccus oceanibius TaxID=2707525 RepID=A0A6B3L938_9BACT|nr:polysaccharide biosynthesis tyrosine autokinase [Sulfuriroseicoccus oceanibius]QQL44318.1 polysaccharide biosynthesis tyrosine autokinase [Sulfuriroseicoccus oceanibius]